MPWFAIYKKDTGELVSLGSGLPDRLPLHLGVKSFETRPDLGKLTWDPLTLTFKDRPEDPKPQPKDRVIEILNDHRLKALNPQAMASLALVLVEKFPPELRYYV